MSIDPPTSSPEVEELIVIDRSGTCRAPLSALLLREGLSSSSREGIRVSPLGLQARDGERICAAAAALLSRPGEAGAERSAGYDDESFRRAALIIVMEKDQRGTVARMIPGRQHLVFTLVAAAAMADRITLERRPIGSLAQLAEEMRSLRGIVDIDRPEHRRFTAPWRRPTPADPLDVPRGHDGSPEEHDAALRRVVALTLRLRAALPTG